MSGGGDHGGGGGVNWGLVAGIAAIILVLILIFRDGRGGVGAGVGFLAGADAGVGAGSGFGSLTLGSRTLDVERVRRNAQRALGGRPDVPEGYYHFNVGGTPAAAADCPVISQVHENGWTYTRRACP